MQLTSAQRRQLRALAHSLKPAVRVARPKGDAAPVLDAGVLGEIGRQLEALELIKVKLEGAKKVHVGPCLEAIQASTGAVWVQTIGHTLVLYKPAAEPTIRLHSEAEAAEE